MRAREEPGGRKARPGDEAENNDEESNLDWRGNTESTELFAVMDEQVAVAEQCRGAGQCLSHYVPAPKLQARCAKARRAISIEFRSSPAPSRRALPRASTKRHCFRMVNEFNLRPSLAG